MNYIMIPKACKAEETKTALLFYPERHTETEGIYSEVMYRLKPLG